jgi:mercuric ion binding protein
MTNRFLAALVLFAAAMTANAGEMRNVTLDVKGMDCVACPVTVKVVLKKQLGVDEVKMDAANHTAEVKFDAAKISPDQLAKVVTEAGYPATARK